jgi:hypothetical protein
MSERDPLAPAFEIPDLELEPAISKRPAAATGPLSARQAPPATAAIREISLDDNDDDFDSIQSGSSVSLALGASPAEPAMRIEIGGWPSGRTRPVDQLPIDPAEVAIVAGYGPAPKVALLAPIYAYRVFSRRGPLTRAVAEQHAALTAVELERDTLLAKLASELRPQLEVSDAFRRAFEPLREVERLASDRSAALSQADSGYREQMARFDDELGKLRQAEAAARADFDFKDGAKSGTESALRRAEAKLQRVQIELRGVLDLARQALGPAGGELRPEDASQVTELKARAAAIEPEVAQAKSAHQATTAACDKAHAETRRLQAQIRQLEQQKQNAGSNLGQELTVRAAGVSEAEKQRRDALAEVARGVLLARGSVPVAGDTLEALRHHDKVAEAHAIRLETHLRALSSYDRERVKLGVIVVLSALGVVLLSILLKAML